VHHSDRGVQYASRDYTALLQARGIAISMSRKANPYDNAIAESFMKTLKYEESIATTTGSARSPHLHPAILEQVYNEKSYIRPGYLPPVDSSSAAANTASPRGGNRLACAGSAVEFPGMRNLSPDPNSKPAGRPTVATQRFGTMSFQLAIPWRVALRRATSASPAGRIVQDSAQSVQSNCSER